MLYDYVLYPIIEGLILSVIGAVVGTFLILRRAAFAVAGIVHVAMGGTLVAFLAGIDPCIGAFVSALLFSAAVSLLIEDRGAGVPVDAIVGVLFAFGTAVAVAAASLSREYVEFVWGLFFGNIFGVTEADIVLSLSVAVLVAAIALVYGKQIIAVFSDPGFAKAIGLSPLAATATVMFMAAISSAVALKAVGTLLVLAYFVVPAAAAYEFSHSVSRMVQYAILFSTTATVLGIVTSLFVDIAASALITFYAIVEYVIAHVLSPKRRVCKCIYLGRR